MKPVNGQNFAVKENIISVLVREKQTKSCGLTTMQLAAVVVNMRSNC